MISDARDALGTINDISQLTRRSAERLADVRIWADGIQAELESAGLRISPALELLRSQLLEAVVSLNHAELGVRVSKGPLMTFMNGTMDE